MDTTPASPVATELTENEIANQRFKRDLIHFLLGIQMTLFFVTGAVPDTNGIKTYMWIALLIASVIRGYFEIKEKNILSIIACVLTAAYALNGLTT